MFKWFQRLLPHQGDFFAMFEAHAATLVAAAEAMTALAQNGASASEQLRIIADREHDADDIIREVLTSVRRTFLTPFDRSAITSLIASMDDAIDEMHAAARALDLYEINALEPEMKEIVALVARAADLTVEAMPLLRDVAKNGAHLHKLTEQLVKLEGEADEFHAAGLKKAFKQHCKGDPMQFIVCREIFNHLERVTDAFEDVANEIDGIVIDHG